MLLFEDISSPAELRPGYEHRVGFASNHPGGVNFLFGDGSVHFVSETIDHNTDGNKNSVLEYLICYKDGHPVSDW